MPVARGESPTAGQERLLTTANQSGGYVPLHAKFMTSTEFEKILDRLHTLGVLTPQSNIALVQLGRAIFESSILPSSWPAGS